VNSHQSQNCFCRRYPGFVGWITHVGCNTNFVIPVVSPSVAFPGLAGYTAYLFLVM
jgi:hypothetical protein